MGSIYCSKDLATMLAPSKASVSTDHGLSPNCCKTSATSETCSEPASLAENRTCAPNASPGCDVCS